MSVSAERNIYSSPTLFFCDNSNFCGYFQWFDFFSLALSGDVFEKQRASAAYGGAARHGGGEL